MRGLIEQVEGRNQPGDAGADYDHVDAHVSAGAQAW
jgi:hypothetical protein